MIVVSDTSAISALLDIGQIDLLTAIYGDVFIPEAVQSELRVAHVRLPSFVRVVPITDHAFCARLIQELDDGEAEAIVLAKELKADDLLIDEIKGRRVAIREGIHVIGLLGVVLEAKLRRLTPSVRKIIEQLEGEVHFHIADSLKETILREASEL